jgi:hypothetical protein
MSDSREQICPKCSSLTSHVIFHNGGEFIFKNGTRRATLRQRHGHKKQESTLTPTESAVVKAKESEAQRIQETQNSPSSSSDPYSAFR